MFKCAVTQNYLIEIQKMNKNQDDNTSIVIERDPPVHKHSRFQMITSPEIFARVKAVKTSQQKRANTHTFHLTNLLESKRGPNVRKINAHRETYRQIKEKIAKTLEGMQSSKRNLSLGEVMLWKQQVLASFMSEYLMEIEKECKQKADILLFIWNSVFNIIDWLFEVIGKLSKQEEKDYLSNLIDNHKSYQSIIDNLNAKIAKREQEYARQEEFIKALVYNLRFKRKEIKKLSKNLKVCTFRLNEIKDFYLDLQVEHIELLSENRDISKENAKNLVMRKQEINHEKRKEFKLKQSHKKIRFQIENEILNENANESQNVDKLNEDLQVTFQKYYEKNKSTGQKINYPSAQNIFENALDDFNVRIQEVPQTESLIDFKSNINFVDAETDMAGFALDVEDKYTEITFNDRLFEDMISHMAVQTQEIKAKPKVYEEKAIEVDFQEMKSLTFTRVRVYDNSYLISDYRDKRYKNERGIGLRLGQDRSTSDSREIHYQERIKSKGYINYEDGHMGKSFKDIVNEVGVQTEATCIMYTHGIPLQVRNIKLQKEIDRYFQKLNHHVLRERTKQEQNITNQKSSLFTKKVNFKNKSLLHSQSQNSIDLDGVRTPSQESGKKLKSKLGTSRSLPKSKYRIEIHQSSYSAIKFDQELNSKEGSIHRIEEHKYEHMGSKQYEENAKIEEGRSASISKSESQKKQKFWFMKPEGPSAYHKKEKFLNDLNKGDQLLSKTSIYKKNDVYLENKKILCELEKLSEEIQHMSGNFDLIEQTAHDNMSALREELKKMLSKKRNNRKLALSRQQSLCRVISFVYTYAYHLYFNHKKELRNLIIPLFHHFKIGYGEIKKNDLYLRMLYFLSQTICHQTEYYIFESFILFLGLNITGQRQLKVGHETTCLYLKLLHKLSINFRFPLSVEQLYTTVQYFDQKCKEVLAQQRLQQSIIEKIIGQVKLKLKSINPHHNTQESENNQFEETKLNVFKCCELIIQEIEKIKSGIEESYEGVLGYFRKEGGPDSKEFITYVVKNSYLPTQECNNKLKSLQEVRNNMSETKFYSNLGKTLMQMRMPTFEKIYYVALAKYKIKQEFLYLSLNRRLNFMLQYLKKHEEEFKTEQVIIDSIISRKDSAVLKQQTTKRVMALAYLRIVENESAVLLRGMLGDDLSVFL